MFSLDVKQAEHIWAIGDSGCVVVVDSRNMTLPVITKQQCIAACKSGTVRDVHILE